MRREAGPTGWWSTAFRRVSVAKNRKNMATKLKLPSLKELGALVRAVKKDICHDYRAFEEDTEPGIQLTVGASEDGSWDYQTGDNSYTGGAYGHAFWGVIGVYKHTNCREAAKDLQNQIAELQW